MRRLTPHDLQQAILSGDLNRVQAILTPRNPEGKPLVDLNSGYDLNARHRQSGATYVDGTALELCTHANPLNLQIFHYLLSIRDNARNVVIDLNHVCPGGRTIAYAILGWAYEKIKTPAMVREMLQAIVDTRQANGQMACSLGTHRGVILLTEAALDWNDPNILMILLDARRDTGEPALDVNEIDRNHKTLLDYALEKNNMEIIQLVQRAGGRRARDLLRVQTVRQQAQPRIQNNPNPDVVTAFNANLQNTHDPSVTHTAVGSLRALHNTYSSSINESLCVSEIEQLLGNFNYESITVDRTLTREQKQQAAKSFFALLKSRFNIIHSYTGYTHEYILSLIWMAVKDDQAKVFPDDIRHVFPEGAQTAPAHIIATKKASLVEKFIAADIEYKSRGISQDICVGGAIHKILEALNKAHVDVVIATGSQSVLPAANDMAVAIIGRYLSIKQDAEIREILSTWNQDDSCASKFKNFLVAAVNQKLTDHFGILLTEVQRKEITDNMESSPRPPVPHKGLNELVDKFENLYSKSEYKAKVIANLKRFSVGIYQKHLTYEEMFLTLKPIFENFNKLELLIKEINEIPDDATNRPRQAVIISLKKAAERAYENADTLNDQYNLLKSKLDDFVKLESLIKEIKGIPDDATSRSLQAAVSSLKDKAEMAYENSNTLMDKYRNLYSFQQKFYRIKAVLVKGINIPSYPDYIFRKNAIYFLENKIIHSEKSIEDIEKMIEEFKIFDQHCCEFFQMSEDCTLELPLNVKIILRDTVKSCYKRYIENRTGFYCMYLLSVGLAILLRDLKREVWNPFPLDVGWQYGINTVKKGYTFFTALRAASDRLNAAISKSRVVYQERFASAP